jgi:predicted aconitase with swiveling domain
MMPTVFPTRVLVRGNQDEHHHRHQSEHGNIDDGVNSGNGGSSSNPGDGGGDGWNGRTGSVSSSSSSANVVTVHPVLISSVPLSFWGGIDEKTGIVIDTSHPLFRNNERDMILCLLSGWGSCTASQVLLELILIGNAPRALVLRDHDRLVCVGALIAQSVFPETMVLDILQLQQLQSNTSSTTTKKAPTTAPATTAREGMDAWWGRHCDRSTNRYSSHYSSSYRFQRIAQRAAHIREHPAGRETCCGEIKGRIRTVVPTDHDRSI